MKDVVGILLAAGNGSRVGERKQFAKVHEKRRLYECALYSMANSGVFNLILLVIPEGEEPDHWKQEDVITCHHSWVKKCFGGKTRIESLFNALKVCKDSDGVIFHDAARPYITTKAFRDIHALLVKEQQPVVTFAREADSTVTVGDMRWENYPHTLIRRMQTPNAFPTSLLYELCERIVTSGSEADSAIGEYIERGGKFSWYEDPDLFNDKVTTPADLDHARRYFT